MRGLNSLISSPIEIPAAGIVARISLAVGKEPAAAAVPAAAGGDGEPRGVDAPVRPELGKLG